MLTDVGFELQYALWREGIGDDLALSCVVGPITGIEDAESLADGHERVVEIALQTSVPMSVDDSKGVWVGD